MCRHCSETNELNGDIFDTLLLKFPAKSLGRFSCVCKSWCSLFKTPKFIKSHMDDSSSDINRQKVLFVTSEVTLSSCLHFNTLRFSLYSIDSSLTVNSQALRLEPPLPALSDDVCYPSVSSCNGLLCLVYTYTIILWNPTIKKFKQIPKLLIYGNDSALYGFAYDSITEEYKVAAIVVVRSKHNRYFVLIYSISNQSWREIDTIPPGFRLLDQTPVSVDGTINMIAAQENDSASEEFALISLFVAEEKITVTPLPLMNGRYMRLYNFANRLYLSMFVEMEFMVCYLEKLDGEIGWQWAYIKNVPLLDSVIENRCYLDEIVCLKGNGDIIWRKTDGGFLEYKVLKGEVTEFTLDGFPQSAELSAVYFESFASLQVPWD